MLTREPSVDFLTAGPAGLHGLKDPDVLALAAASRRVLVSHDVGTMPAHFRAYRQARRTSAGVLLVRQSLDVATAIDELHLVWLASEAEDWVNRLAWLPL